MAHDYPERLAEVRGGLVRPLVIQLALLLLSSLNLDGGFTSGMVAIGIIAHWAAVAIIAVRRRNRLTRGDVILIRVGYVLFMGAILPLYLLMSLGYALMHQ